MLNQNYALQTLSHCAKQWSVFGDRTVFSNWLNVRGRSCHQQCDMFSFISLILNIVLDCPQF